MIYFSEIQGKRVVTEDQVNVGILEDIIFRASEQPYITKIVVRGMLKEKLIIPIEYIRKFNQTITLGKEYIISELQENELHLVKNLLDKQIIDLKGDKIVRVNDVAIQDKGTLYIAGVDIGFLGILRRLGWEEHITRFLGHVGIKITSQFLSWGDIQPLELVHGAVRMKRQEGKLKKIQPENLAGYLERTNINNAQKFLRILDEKKAAEVIGSLNLNYLAALFKQYKPERAAHLLTRIDPDEAVDILLTLPAKKRQSILERLSDDKKKDLEYLIRYSTTQIGGLLTTEYLGVRAEDLTREVMKEIKNETTEFSFMNPIYVVNEKKELIGAFNLHELILQDAETPVYKFMVQNVVVLHLSTPAEIALKRMTRYDLGALPVIDTNKNILGIVLVSDLVKLLYEKNL